VRRAVAEAGGQLNGREVSVLAMGKAAVPMAAAFLAEASCRVVGGMVVSTSARTEASSPLTFLEGAHPVPDLRSLAAGEAALGLAAGLGPDGMLVVLVSGGASAMTAVPSPGLTLQDKQEVTRRLLLGGADIVSLNTVRKHLSAIKGGRLAASCRAPLCAWLLSDVVGDDPSVIGSGPTVPDPSTFADALAVLERHGGRSQYPADVVRLLERGQSGAIPETPKAGDGALSRATTRVIGSGRLSLDGAAAEARALGYAVAVRPTPVVGEAREAARSHLEWLDVALGGVRGPLCLLSAGETTVTVHGGGKGGRNQEFALALAAGLSLLGRPVVAASIGTDGIDGPTNAAGARVDDTTLARASARGLDARAALAANDSWSFFAALGDLVLTGPTDTNVGDIQIVVAGPSAPPGGRRAPRYSDPG
jgi:glycerate 2-kinase